MTAVSRCEKRQQCVCRVGLQRMRGGREVSTMKRMSFSREVYEGREILAAGDPGRIIPADSKMFRTLIGLTVDGGRYRIAAYRRILIDSLKFVPPFLKDTNSTSATESRNFPLREVVKCLNSRRDPRNVFFALFQKVFD